MRATGLAASLLPFLSLPFLRASKPSRASAPRQKDYAEIHFPTKYERKEKQADNTIVKTEENHRLGPVHCTLVLMTLFIVLVVGIHLVLRTRCALGVDRRGNAQHELPEPRPVVASLSSA